MLRYPDHTRSIISSICPPREGGGLLEGEVECEDMGYLLGIAKKCEGILDVHQLQHWTRVHGEAYGLGRDTH